MLNHKNKNYMNVVFLGGELDGHMLELPSETVKCGFYLHSIIDYDPIKNVEVYEFVQIGSVLVAVNTRKSPMYLAPKMHLGDIQTFSNSVFNCSTCNGESHYSQKQHYKSNVVSLISKPRVFNIYSCEKCEDELEILILTCMHCKKNHQHVLTERYKSGEPNAYIKDFKCLKCGTEQQIYQRSNVEFAL